MKKILLLILVIFATLPAIAQTVQINGLNYNLDSNRMTAEVGSNSNFSGAAVIPESVTYGGNVYKVTSIRYNAFSGCWYLTSVTIPNSVTEIGQRAFSNCSRLTSVTIGNSVTSIGDGAFFGSFASSGTKVNISNLAAWCKIKFSDEFSNPLYYAHHLYLNGIEVKDLVIPNSVISIGNYAFYECSSLTSVTIPNSVTSIGRDAFSGCSGLKSVTIPNSVTSIGQRVFSGCKGLTSVTIPNSVTYIGERAFYYCRGLTSVTIPNSVISIGDAAFSECTVLTDFVLEDGNKEIAFEVGAWSGTPIKNLYIGRNWTFGGTETFPTTITTLTIGNGVTTVPANSFSNCTGLTSLEVKDGNKEIAFGSSAFAKASIRNLYIGRNWTFAGTETFPTSLTRVSIGNSVTSIGESAFENCTGLTSVTIGNSVTSIGRSAFADCWRLTSVTIPNSVISIGSYAFYKCSGLTSITIPDSVTGIGVSAFESCTGLKDFVVEDGDKEIAFGYLALYGAPIENLYMGRTWNGSTYGTRPESISTGIKNVTIGNRVTKLPAYAFASCTSLTEVAVPSSVKEIGNNAFDECSNLTSIAIGTGIEKVGDNILNGCNNVKDIYVTALEAPQASDKAISNYNIPLWVTPGAENSYYDAIGCWWKFNTIKQLVVPTSFTANRTDFSGKVGDQFRLRGIFEPSDVTLPYVFFTSSDRTVATVDATGLVTILDDEGSCEITLHNLYADNNYVTVNLKGANSLIPTVENVTANVTAVTASTAVVAVNYEVADARATTKAGVEYRLKGDEEFAYAAGSLTQTILTLTGLDAKRDYTAEYRVLLNDEVASETATVAFTTSEFVPPTFELTSVRLTDVTQNSVRIALEYTLDNAEPNNTLAVEYRLAGDNEYAVAKAGMSSATIEIDNLQPETTYTVEYHLVYDGQMIGEDLTANFRTAGFVADKPTVTRNWLTANGLANADYRGGTAFGGKVYMPSGNTIAVIDGSGVTKVNFDVATFNKGATSDDKGNIIVYSGWATGVGLNTAWLITPENFSKGRAELIELSQIDNHPLGRADFPGRAVGDFMSAEGGVFFNIADGVAVPLVFKNGQQVTLGIRASNVNLGGDNMSVAVPSVDTMEDFNAAKNPSECFYARHWNSGWSVYTAENGQMINLGDVKDDRYLSSNNPGLDVFTLGGETYRVLPARKSDVSFSADFVIVDSKGNIFFESNYDSRFGETSTRSFGAGFVARKINDNTVQLYQIYTDQVNTDKSFSAMYTVSLSAPHESDYYLYMTREEGDWNNIDRIKGITDDEGSLVFTNINTADVAPAFRSIASTPNEIDMHPFVIAEEDSEGNVLNVFASREYDHVIEVPYADNMNDGVIMSRANGVMCYPTVEEASAHAWKAGTDACTIKVTPVTGQIALIKTSSTTTGLEDIDVDSADSDTECYYNLQGVRMSGHRLPAGVYIRRQGKTVTKVIIK